MLLSGRCFFACWRIAWSVVTRNHTLPFSVVSTSAQNGAIRWPLVGNNCGRLVTGGVLNESSPSFVIYINKAVTYS